MAHPYLFKPVMIRLCQHFKSKAVICPPRCHGSGLSIASAMQGKEQGDTPPQEVCPPTLRNDTPLQEVCPYTMKNENYLKGLVFPAFLSDADGTVPHDAIQ